MGASRISNRWLNAVRLMLLAGCMVFVLALYITPLAYHFAYTDTYEFLHNARNSNFINVFVQGGRPLFGWWLKAILVRLHTVDQLIWARLFGIAGIFLAAAMVFLIFKRWLNSISIAILGAFFFLTSPGATLAGLWVATFQLGWSLALGLMGGLLVSDSLDASNAGGKKNIQLACGVTLGLCSMFLYQPGYTAFLAPAMIAFLRSWNLRRVITFVSIYFLLYLAYFVIFKATIAISGLPPLERSGFTTHPILKLGWFVVYPFMMSMEDNSLFYPTAVQWFIAAVTLAVIVFGIVRGQGEASSRTKWARTILLALFFVVAYIPNLVSSDNEAAYRTLSSLFLMKWILIINGTLYLPPLLTRWLAGVAVVVVAANAWYNSMDGFVYIQSREYSLIRAEVLRLSPQLRANGRLVFIRPDFEFLADQGIVRRAVTDEFGNLSTSRKWVPGPMVRQILREQGDWQLEKSLHIIQLDSVNAQMEHEVATIDIGELYLASLK